MPFSYRSFTKIWERSGGKDLASCYTCGVKHIQGYTLDCSHLDHTRNEGYDDPIRGVLECLECHLRRHISIYFFSLIKGKKKEIREARFACMSLVFRITAGEDKWDGTNVPNSKADIKKTKSRIATIFSVTLKNLIFEAEETGITNSEIKWLKEKIFQLRDMI